jgi:hypothetical protein
MRGINRRVRGIKEEAKGVANRAAYHVASAMEATFPVRRRVGQRPPDHGKVASFSRVPGPSPGNSGHDPGQDRPNSAEILGIGAIAPSPESVFATSRLRFGIESSYRQMHEGRIRTTTRRPTLRLLYVGIALVLRNLRVWLHYAILSMPRRGGRVILLERLRWETLLLWLLHVVEESFGVADVTYTERGIEYELAL